MKKIISVLSIALLLLAISSCGGKSEKNNTVLKVIKEAEGMTLDQLFEKAYEESNGKVLKGLGNSSRGKTAGETFVEAMKAKYPDYTGKIDWSQPKNNTIFDQLTNDNKNVNPEFSMTLIQDGAQIKAKMIDTGILHNFVPKEWKESAGTDMKENGNPLALQTLSKVFMYNNVEASNNFLNVWDFVKEGQSPLFMGLESEPIGKNFLLMLTHEKYSKVVKAAYDALPEADKAYFKPIVDGLEKTAKELGLNENGKYALAWIKLFVSQFNMKTDDGPISVDLVKKSSKDQTGLLVYSKLRSIKETEESSVNNITVAAYQDGYTGFGGYAYKHYLQVLNNAPLPWTACAFIAYMVTTKEGFHPWGKDMGGYSSNPAINQDHSMDGYVDEEVNGEVKKINKFPAKNDRGYDWWTGEGKGGLIVEEPVYCASVTFTVGEWISSLRN